MCSLRAIFWDSCHGTMWWKRAQAEIREDGILDLTLALKELLGPGQHFPTIINPTFSKIWWSQILKYRQEAKIKYHQNHLKNARGGHNIGAWRTTLLLLLSPVLPILPLPPTMPQRWTALLLTQLNTGWSGWLAFRSHVVTKTAYFLFKHRNHVQWGEVLPKKHVVPTEATVPGV